MPPQETGLTYNSWFGKPHLEMHWWHGVHFAQWGRATLMERSLGWYEKTQNEARTIAKRQGYEGSFDVYSREWFSEDVESAVGRDERNALIIVY